MVKNARTSADTRIRFSNQSYYREFRSSCLLWSLYILSLSLDLDPRLYIFIRLKRISLFRLLVFSFFFPMILVEMKNFDREGKKNWSIDEWIFWKFWKTGYFWYVSIYAFMNICVETLKRLLLLLFLLRRYTEYVLKALEDRRKPVSEISRVMILASTYNVVVWIYYISWKRRS